jgi:urea transport system ATP-binding protein
MLRLVDVTSYYDKTPILHDVNVELAKGESLCVIGRNGVGKTTLMQTIMGLTTRIVGKVFIGCDDVTGLGTADRARAGLGYVPQGRRIFSKFTVRENIVLGTFARLDGNTQIPDICLRLFPYLRDNLDKKAGFLSGGQLQQLAIARALATDPSILLLDEPTEGIQPNIIEDIYASLLSLNRDMGMTLILTEQHIKLARTLCDKYIIMDTGRIVASGYSKDLTDDIVNAHLSI